MDLKDKRIVKHLDLCARKPVSQIARDVRLSKAAVGERIRSLENRGIVGGYTTLINMARLGFTGYGVFARLEGAGEADREKVISILRSRPEVYWMARLGGNYDLLFAIRAKTVLEFDNIFAALQQDCSPSLNDVVISIRVQVTQFPRSYLVEEDASSDTPFFGKEIVEASLDELDIEILNALSEDARVNVVDLASSLGVPRTTVSYRKRLLEKNEIVQGYSSLVHAEKCGYQIYQLMITAKSASRELKSSLFEYCRSSPWIVFYVESVGKWQFEITCEVEGQEKLQEIIMDLRGQFADHLMSIEIILVFDYYMKYKIMADKRII